MKNKTSVSIGIPAYNEEANIGKLIKSLLKQKQVSFKLKEIIVVSDCSSDKTDEIVKAIKNSKVKLFRNKERSGQAISQNKLKKYCNAEIIVLLNADILPGNNKFLENLVLPIIKNPKVGIVCPRAMVLPARNFFESVINISVEMKNNMFENWNSGNNLFTSKGTARAIKRSLFKNLIWPKLIAEDAYTYLDCLKSGFLYRYNSKALIYYRSPDNFKDHQRQSLRFSNNKNELLKYFDQRFVDKEFNFPQSILIENIINSFLKNPIEMSVYLVINLLVKLIPAKKPTAIWQQSLSTKQI